MQLRRPVKVLLLTPCWALVLSGCGGLDLDLPEPTPEDDPNVLAYGESIDYLVDSRPEDVPVRITVSAPEPFAPGPDAFVTDARTPAGIVHDSELYDENIFFAVTIENLSGDQVYDNDFLFSDVTLPEHDDTVSEVRDDQLRPSLGGTEIQPGEALTMKDGYSVKVAEGVVYELKIGGLGGDTFTWTPDGG